MRRSLFSLTLVFASITASFLLMRFVFCVDYTMTSSSQPTIVGCCGCAVKDDHGGAYPLALGLIFSPINAPGREAELTTGFPFKARSTVIPTASRFSYGWQKPTRRACHQDGLGAWRRGLSITLR